MNKKMAQSFGLLLCIIFISLYAMEEQKPKAVSFEGTQLTQTFATNGLLIFLGDGGNQKANIGVVTSGMLSAFIQEAGLIIASASIIAGIHETEMPTEKDERELSKRLDKISDINKPTREDLFESKQIILSVVKFDDQVTNKWIIKEINPSLYLLVPKKYLQSKAIRDEDVESFNDKESITPTEQALGLKVNHMKTVEVNDIKRPQIAPKFADYFTEALDSLFVTKSEYKAIKSISPTWAVYIYGHGMYNSSITHLSFTQFKYFLNFLETKIITKILLYSSCYAAGVGAKILYKDVESAINKTYSFAIITSAITDAPTYGYEVTAYLYKKKLTIKTLADYANFLQQVTTSNTIDFSKLVPLIINVEDNLPQIKFPGLPWFSVLDRDKAVSIGSILVKTRTRPLDISTFFAHKKGIKANPLGILLYAQDIPFELIIDTRQAPKIISMIPGDVLHHINKISSNKLTIVDILNGFFIGVASHKIFIIEEITGLFTTKYIRNSFGEDELSLEFLENINLDFWKKKVTLQNLILDLTEKENRIYFTYKNKVYFVSEKPSNDNPAIRADMQMEKNYYSILLRQYELEHKMLENEIEAIEKKSVHKYLTPENIAKIKETLITRKTPLQEQEKQKTEKD